MPTIKQYATAIFQSKTLLFSMALAGLSAFQAGLEMFNFSPRTNGFLGVLLAIIIAALRFNTSDSITEKASIV